MLLRILLLFCSTGAALAAPPLKVLIVTGNADLPYHHWQETTASLRAILEQTGRFEVRVTEEPRGLTAEALQGYDAVVLNYNGPRWPSAAETALESFVRQGKGLLAFHQAIYGAFFGHEFRDQKWYEGPTGSGWAAFPKMIGASWDPVKLGHAKRGIFKVEWKDPSHPVCRQLPASFIANDELYHRLTLFPGVHVLADALSPKETGGTGQREPLIWTNDYGRGRVLFTTLGHDAMAFYQTGMIDLIARGTEWVASGEVTLPPAKTHSAALLENPIFIASSPALISMVFEITSMLLPL
jgi:type 1 glutamine amidotransferase